MSRIPHIAVAALGTSITLGLVCSPAWAGPVAFTNVAEDPAMGLTYERARSASYADLIAGFTDSITTPLSFFEVSAFLPARPTGFPGIALIDFDNDGDTDIYVTNGPGVANSLFSNQLVQTGSMSFVDVGATSGADATDLDSNGVCFGDLDNDGDEDLFVLGRDTANRLYENQGGTFAEVFNSRGRGRQPLSTCVVFDGGHRRRWLCSTSPWSATCSDLDNSAERPGHRGLSIYNQPQRAVPQRRGAVPSPMCRIQLGDPQHGAGGHHRSKAPPTISWDVRDGRSSISTAIIDVVVG